MGHSAHCASDPELRGWSRFAPGRRDTGDDGPRGAPQQVSSYAVDAQPELLSLLALRQRAIRLWLAAIGLLGFGVAYVSPMALALRAPAVVAPITLPALSLPL